MPAWKSPSGAGEPVSEWYFSRKEWQTGYVPSEHNPSDTQTKTVPAGVKRKRLVSMYLYDIYDDDS